MDNKYKPIPFWSWNGELDENKLTEQIEWMHKAGIGGFFMHARGGLTTPYLGDKWFSCVKACIDKAKELNMEAYAYDENGWPSGFVGGKLLEDIENHDMYVDCKKGEYDPKAVVSYILKDNELIKVKEGKDCYNIYITPSNSTVDILNPKVVDQFINETHEKYKDLDQKTKYLKGFFTDEPQYARWGIPFTKVLKEYFDKKYNSDVIENIGLLFIKANGYETYRYRYYLALQSLMLENYSKKIYNWCDSNGYKLTGHYCEENSLDGQMWCCAGVMPFYEYEHIPGIDYLGRDIAYSGWLGSKQLGSVAAQLGKKQTLVETFACCGWDVTPDELRVIAEHSFIDGVNNICHHLLPYEENGQRKRDYPSHFNDTNPWIKEGFKEFNDYFSSLGYLLSTSKEVVNVGIIQPIRSMYLNYQRFVYGEETIKLDVELQKLMVKLQDLHIPFHFIDETLLEKYGSIDNDKLVMGSCSYDYVILPYMLTMGETTYKLLKQYSDNQGKIHLYEGKPTYLEGNKHDYDWLKSNYELEDILASLPFKFNSEPGVISSYRIDENDNPYLYIMNFDQPRNIYVSFNGFKSVKRHNLITNEDVIESKELSLKSYESIIVYPSNEIPTEKKEFPVVHLKDKFTLNKPINNYLLLDNISYSVDNGKTYFEAMNYMGVFIQLLNKRYKGKVLLKYTFESKINLSHAELLVEDAGFKSISVNGTQITKIKRSDVENHVLICEVQDLIKIGANEIIEEMDYYQDNNVYFVLFETNDTESLKNCLAYTMTIEAITLVGNFGVYGQIEQGDSSNTYQGKDFYIDTQKKEIKSLINDGFPFFRGPITLTQDISFKDKAILDIPERFQLIDVSINNEYMGRMMFNHQLEIDNKSNNEFVKLSLTLYVSNRNLCGPNHNEPDEVFAVGPYSWEHFDRDENRLLKEYDTKDYYTFVKTII